MTKFMSGVRALTAKKGRRAASLCIESWAVLLLPTYGAPAIGSINSQDPEGCWFSGYRMATVTAL